MKAGWELKPLGDVCSMVRGPFGGSLKKGIFKPKGYAVYEQQHAINDQFHDFRYFIDDRKFNEMARFSVQPGDLIMSCSGTMGRVARVPSEAPAGIINQALLKLSPSRKLEPDFLLRWMASPGFQGQLSATTMGVAIKNVASVKTLKSLPIPLPSLEEQQRIVAILDETFEGLARAQAHAEANLQSARELFENSLFRVFGGLEGAAPRLTLGEAAITFGRGKSRHRPRNAPSLYGGDYPFVQTGDIRNSRGTVTTFTQCYSEQGLAQSKLWPAGTICITIAANIAETAVLGFDACFPDSIIGMVANPKITFPEYVEFMLRYFAGGLKALGKGSAQDNINLATFEEATFPFPPYEAQVRIVEQLTQLTEVTSHLAVGYETKLQSIDSLRQSLLQKAFAGELT